MFRISRLHELMKGFPRGEFDRLVCEHQGDKHNKGFDCWDQLVAMVYAQLSGVSALRELVAGFNAHGTHHYHLGTAPVRRSTLAEANARRCPEVFSGAARALMAQADRRLRSQCTELLYLLDSTSITLKGPGFDGWTLKNRTRRTQGIKLHLLYAGGERLPLAHSLTAPNVNDIDEALKLPIEAGATYVFDKGYCDYNWWARIDAQNARFVTRFKRNAALLLECERAIAPEEATVVLADSVVRLANRHPRGGKRNRYTSALRRIVIDRPDKETPLVLATNDMKTPAAVIAQRYRQRWEIETYFKWIKQHLKIKRFLGRSENAVRLQIVCALIAYLLLAAYKATHAVTASLWELLAELRGTLFQRPALEAHSYRRRRERTEAFAALQPPLFA